jgi:hypothetical protein
MRLFCRRGCAHNARRGAWHLAMAALCLRPAGGTTRQNRAISPGWQEAVALAKRICRSPLCPVPPLTYSAFGSLELMHDAQGGSYHSVALRLFQSG